MRNRRWISVLLALCVTVAAAVSFAEPAREPLPTRSVFSKAYERLFEAVQSGRALRFDVRVEPEAVRDYASAAMTALSAMVGAVTLSGEVAAAEDGGMFTVGVNMNGATVASFGQSERDGGVALMVDGEWIGADAEADGQLSEAIGLGEAGAALLSLDYAGLRNGDVPFFTVLGDQLELFWLLASPYSEDNGNLHLSSGATSHGMTYTIDTDAFREIMTEWVEGFTREGLSFGIPGTPLTLGATPEGFDALMLSLRAFAQTATLSGPVKMNMVFGEGDVLRSARLKGTLLEGKRKTDFSFNYSCAVTKTRITRKYSLDFRPKTGDTIVLSATSLTSSNGKTSGAQNFSLSASGTFGGEPYRIKCDSELVNRFSVANDGFLGERVTGKTAFSVKYANSTVVDASIQHDGNARSAQAMQDISANETFDIAVKTAAGALFQGTITLSLAAGDKPDAPPAAVAQVSEMDADQLYALRVKIENAFSNARIGLIAALPSEAMEALLNAY